MNLWRRFKRLTIWHKLGAIGAVCSILGVALCFLFLGPETSVKVNVQDSRDAKVQTAVNSPNATQILTEKVTIELPLRLKPKLSMSPMYVNKLEDNRYVTLLRGKLTAPYPVPYLRVEVHGQTVEKIDLTPVGSAICMSGPPGKREGYVFTTLHNAKGNLQLKIVSRQPEKLRIYFSVQE